MNRQTILTGIKAAGSAAAAILVASLLSLPYSATAGIIAILSLMGSKRETLKVALGRLMAYASALLIAFVCFSLLGDGLLAFGVYLFLFAALCYACSWGYATAMVSVLISHFMGSGGMTWMQVGNETLLFLIGTTCGIVTNLHLRPDEKRMQQLLGAADDGMRQVLSALSKEDGVQEAQALLDKLHGVLQQAAACAERNAANSLMRTSVVEIRYIAMRQQQRRVLVQMTTDWAKLCQHPSQEAEVRAFMGQVAREYHLNNSVLSLTEALHALLRQMQEQPLPRARKEFENRALLYGILRRMEDFLMLKRTFYLENVRDADDTANLI